MSTSALPHRESALIGLFLLSPFQGWIDCFCSTTGLRPWQTAQAPSGQIKIVYIGKTAVARL